MAELQMNTLGLSFACAMACARFRVLTIRLSRIFSFFDAVQRPTMLSPARWMTASNPEMDSGAMGFAGSHGIVFVVVFAADLLRESRVISAPLDSSDGMSAPPMKPDAPLMRMRFVPELDTTVDIGLTLSDLKAREHVVCNVEWKEFPDAKIHCENFECIDLAALGGAQRETAYRGTV